MVRPGRDPLSGVVEVDETFIGGPKAGRRRRGAEGKSLVVIAAQADGKGIGRIRMRHLSHASAGQLEAFITQTTQKGSSIITDAWRGYNRLDVLGYAHQVVEDHSLGETIALPRVHRVAALLKRWLLGIHHGAIGAKHLEYYLDEFTFRFNRGKSRHRGMLFWRLLQQAVLINTPSYQKIVASSYHKG